MRIPPAAFCLVLAAALSADAADAFPPAPASSNRIRFVEFTSIVSPASAEWLAKIMDAADRDRDDLVLIRLNTPGGRVDSMEEIVQRILASKTPVVIWVGPSGVHAASAGFFILVSADIAAMAPGTRTGAASPVGGGGEDIAETMNRKVSNDLAALIRSIATKRGRDVDACEAAVYSASAFTEEEALKNGIINLIARDRDDLLKQLDGREVRRFDGTTVVLHTAHAQIVDAEKNTRDQFLDWLSNPELSGLLLAIGMLCLTIELSNPGMIVPAVVGVVCLVLFAFSASVLPISLLGLLLIVAAVVLFVLEVKVTSYGLFTLGGLACLIAGALMLYQGPIPEMRLSLPAVLPACVVIAGAFTLIIRLAVGAQRTRVVTGVEGFPGEMGTVTVDLAPEGKVFVHGEIWNAVSAGAPIPRGAVVRVVKVDGFNLVVEPAAPASQGEGAHA